VPDPFGRDVDARSMRFAILEGSLQARAVRPRIRTLALGFSFDEISDVAVGSRCLALSMGQFGLLVTITLIVAVDVRIALHFAMRHRGRRGHHEGSEIEDRK